MKRFLWLLILAIVVTLYSNSLLANDSVLKCSPKSIKTGDEFIIEMKTPHGKDLIITGPNFRTAFLCWSNMTVEKHRNPPLFLRSKCANIKRVVINAGMTRTGGWIFGKNSGPFHGPIFKSSGRYRVVLGENLESNRAKSFECVIEYEAVD